MKFTQKIKKFVAITLAGALVFLNANLPSVQAQDISEVSVKKPGYGRTSTSDGSGVNVRDAANVTTSNIIRSIPNDTFVMIVGQSGDFYKVQYDNQGHYGYMIKRLVEFCPEYYYLQALPQNGNKLDMYDDDWEEYRQVIAQIPKGTCFAYWYRPNEDYYVGVYGISFGYTSTAETGFCFY